MRILHCITLFKQVLISIIKKKRKNKVGVNVPEKARGPISDNLIE